MVSGWLSELETVGAVLRGDDHAPDDPELRRAYRAAVAGLVPPDLDLAAGMGLMPVPEYRVTTDADGEFVVVARRVVTEVERAVMMGDVRRRFLLGIRAGDGGDPFAGVRRLEFVGRWPQDAGRQRRTFPCQVCGEISIHPDDVANRYCVRCHRFTGDPGDPTPGSPLARAVDAGVDVVELPGVDRGGSVNGVRRLQPDVIIVDDPSAGVGMSSGQRAALDEWWRAVSPVVEQPVIPGESS